MGKTGKHQCKTMSFKKELLNSYTYLARLTPRSVPIITIKINRGGSTTTRSTTSQRMEWNKAYCKRQTPVRTLHGHG